MSEVTGIAAPVEPTSPATQAVPAVDTPVVEQVTEAQEGQEPVKPERTASEEAFAKRLAKESRRLERTIRAELRAEIAEKQLAERSQPQEPRHQPEGEPRQEDFKDYDEWILARAEYRVEKKLAKQREESERESASKRENAGMAEVANQVRDRTKAAQDKYDDFREVVDAGAFSPAMTGYLIEAAADAGELAYALGSNIAECRRIYALPPAKQIVEMHKFEAKISAAPKPTQAPRPIVPNGTTSAAEKDPASMTDKEYAAWRKRQIAQRR